MDKKSVENRGSQPHFGFFLSWSIPNSSVLDQFSSILIEKGFTILEKSQSQILGFQMKKQQILDKIQQCLCFMNSMQLEEGNTIKLQILATKNRTKQYVSIRGIRGEMSVNKMIIDVLRQILNSKGRVEEGTEGELFDKIFLLNQETLDEEQESLFKNENQNFIDEDENGHSNHPYSLQSTANYMFYRILSSISYGVGQKVFQYINDFKRNYRSVKESVELLPQPIQSIVHLINEVVENLSSDHNYGKPQTRIVMPYCRSSVEKYVFSKLSEDIYKMYSYREKENDKQLCIKRADITSRKSIIEVFQNLELNERYWLLKKKVKENISESNSTKDTPTLQPDENFEDEKDSSIIRQSSKSMGESFEEKKEQEEKRPYDEAIKELEKLNYAENPRDKLKSAMMMHSMMRAAVVDFHSSKYELASMDDELPVVIYMILYAKVDDLFSQICIIQDFIQLDQTIESERRIIMNLKVSAQYIIQDWKI